MLLSKTAVSFEMIMVGRFLYGINSGEPPAWVIPLNPFLPFTRCFSATLTSPFNPTQDRFPDVFITVIFLSSIRPLVSQLSTLIGSSQNVWFPCAPSGISLTAHSIYLVECAPKRLRGMVGVTVATFISFGKFCGQLLGIRWGVMDAAGSQVGSGGCGNAWCLWQPCGCMVLKLTLRLQRAPRVRGALALAARIQRLHCAAAALHPALPARVPQVSAAGSRRPPGLRERCGEATTESLFMSHCNINPLCCHAPL